VTKPAVTNLPASVRQRLLNLSHQRQEDFNLVLSLYAIERLLYRLSQSPYAGQFVLKGAVLFSVWTGKLHRPTRDLDLLGFGDTSDERLSEVFQAICRHDVPPDGMVFDAESIRITRILEGQEYGGQRLQLSAALDTARIPLQIDIGSGDAITPGARLTRYPTLLDFPAPELRSYPKETVVAEKLHAMVAHGVVNSRMKDYYDLWLLSRLFDFEGALLAKAIRATFERRATPVPASTPIALSPRFATDAQKIVQWQSFLSRSRLEIGSESFEQVVADLVLFLGPPMRSVAAQTSFHELWPQGGPWTHPESAP
jgi:predicted nucleotidyltransferase component of viral defense system